MRKIIGLTGYATSGKDYLFQLLKEYSNVFSKRLMRIALADPLKEELRPFFEEKLNISPFTQVKEQKDLIRPVIVEYARVKRIQSQGTHWTGLAQQKINDIWRVNNLITPVITDIRYDEYPEDELYWLKKKNNGYLIHITRIDHKSGEPIDPPNEDEKRNNEKLKDAADYRIVWKKFLTDGDKQEFITRNYNLLKDIEDIVFAQ